MIGGLAGVGVLCIVLSVFALGGMMLVSKMNAKASQTPTGVAAVLSPTTTAGIVTGMDTRLLLDAFSDDFSNSSSGWATGEDADSKYGYEAGSYRIFVNQPNTLFWSTPNKSFADVAIEVDAAKVGGPDDNYFGIVCRLMDENNYYYLVVSSDGYYTIGKYKDGEFNSLLEGGWHYSDYIHQGRTTNRLGADCLGSNLRLYANNTKLGEAQDSEFASGQVGVLAASLDIAGTDILFDNFTAGKP